MIPLYVGSTTPFAGKHFVALGLARKLAAHGVKVGYFLPYGVSPTRKGGRFVDRDAAFFCESLGMDDSVKDVCPVILTEDTLTRTLTKGVVDNSRKILTAFRRVAAKKDVVIVGGVSGLCYGSIAGFSERQLIQKIGARIVLASRLDNMVESVDGLLAVKRCFGESLKGVIFNRVPENKEDYAAKLIKPFMESRGVHIYAIITNDPILGAISVGDLADHLNATVLIGGQKMDELVERYMVGAMNVSSALKHFRKQRNKAVITGGDRSDIQLAALETSTKCLILTGDMYPSAAILTKADEAGVPVLVVPLDTAETVERCELLMGHMSLRASKKIDRVVELFDTHVDFKRLCADCGIKLKG